MGLTANTGPYNAAAEHYGVDDPVMTKIPRSKYQFALELTINSNDPLVENKGPFIFHRVEGVSLPDYNYNVVRVNEYNRVRYVSTRVEYTPMTVQFYDTKDNAWQHIMQAYARHYSHGHNLDEDVMSLNNPARPAESSPFGINAVPVGQRFFFSHVRIKTKDTATNGRDISCFNCMITQINHDRLAYSDSSPVIWSVQFQPEQVNIESNGDSNGSNAQQGVYSVNQPYDVSRSASAGFYIGQDGNPIRDNTGRTVPFDASIQFNSEGITGNLYATAGPFSVGASIPILRRDRNNQPQIITQGQNVLQNVGQRVNTVINDILNFDF